MQQTIHKDVLGVRQTARVELLWSWLFLELDEGRDWLLDQERQCHLERAALREALILISLR